MGQKIVRLPRRVITFVAAGGLATAGAAALATGWTASAAQSDPLVVWVCKYVGQKDHQVLQDGSPISINWAALMGKTPPEVGGTFSDAQSKSVVVQVGGTDPGSVACLDVTPPTTTTTEPTTTEPTTTEPTTTEPTTAAPTTTVPGGSGAGDGDGDGVPSVPVTTTVPPSTVPTTTAPTTTAPTTKTPATTLPTTVAPTTSTAVPTTTAPATAVVSPPHGSNGGGTTGVVPGVGAPHTGGGGQVSSGNRLLGSSLLAGGLALAAGEALRRRRENAAR